MGVFPDKIRCLDVDDLIIMHLLLAYSQTAYREAHKELKLCSSAIAHRIKKMNESFGQITCVVKGRLQLTDEGRKVCAHADTVLNVLKEI